MVAFCESLAAPELAPWTASGMVSAECPMVHFKEYRLERNLTWPVPTREAFIDKLTEYLGTPDGWAWVHKVRMALKVDVELRSSGERGIACVVLVSLLLPLC